MFSIFFAALTGLFTFTGQDAPEVETRELSYTADRTAMARCLNGLAGARGVMMRCTLDDEGRAHDCTITNPTPAVMRNERVFQCMASRMQFSFSDGASTEGQQVQFQLGGQTVLGEEKLRQAERQHEEERRNRPQP